MLGTKVNLYKAGTDGFVLKTTNTGNDFITLKAKTYQAGNASRIAIARFKIVIPQNLKVFDNS